MAGTATAGPTTISLTSSAFESGRPIPTDYTADGRDISPPLNWDDVPEGTRSLALICEDPDAPRGMFAHWVAYNLPPGLTELKDGIPARESLPDGTSQGTNDFDKTGYGGPSPPAGKPHRYFFHLFALDSRLDLPPGATREQLMSAIQDHVIGKGELIGTYGRSSE